MVEHRNGLVGLDETVWYILQGSLGPSNVLETRQPEEILSSPYQVGTRREERALDILKALRHTKVKYRVHDEIPLVRNELLYTKVTSN